MRHALLLDHAVLSVLSVRTVRRARPCVRRRESGLRSRHRPATQALNINADTAAGEIAAALGAEKLILMTGAAPDSIRPIPSRADPIRIDGSRVLPSAGLVGGVRRACVRHAQAGITPIIGAVARVSIPPH